MKPFKGEYLRVTGEFLANRLNLPKDAIILKVVPTPRSEYIFDVCYFCRDALEVAEGAQMPTKDERDALRIRDTDPTP